MLVKTGLNVLLDDDELRKSFKGNVALLCHNASIDTDYTHAACRFRQWFGNRFIKIFGPQHGFVTDVQDNMVESGHYIHPYFKIPVYSLYSETRIPTDTMLEDIDHLFIDLQDIGCRIYTYIYTMTHILEKCAQKDMEIIVLDRPNPINGTTVEGNVLDNNYRSFVGRHPIPVRHAMTIGEVALMHQKFWAKEKANLRVVKMKKWQRSMYFEDTGLPWVLPSPNITAPESCHTFPATVIFEGTLVSEGRGTTRPLEMVGHPKVEAFSFYEKHLKKIITNSKLIGFVLRPMVFQPVFQKHGGKCCGGFHIHVTDRKDFRPWRLGQLLMREFYRYLGDDFEWKQPPYEYVYDKLPMDIINGTDTIRHWVENNGSMQELESLEMERQRTEYIAQLAEVKCYP